jgi:hypothetical protein
MRVAGLCRGLYFPYGEHGELELSLALFADESTEANFDISGSMDPGHLEDSYLEDSILPEHLRRRGSSKTRASKTRRDSLYIFQAVESSDFFMSIQS